MAKEKTEKILDFEDDGDLILSDIRESVRLLPENARFYRSAGGLVSMDLNTEKYGEESFERVVLLRAFPVEKPNEFISVKTPDTKEDKGKELGFIRYLSEFPEDQAEIISEELDVFYFTPEIFKINSRKEKYGKDCWDAETSAGRTEIVIVDPYRNIRFLGDGKLYISDMDGNAFVISDIKALDPTSFKIVDVFL
ncbi:MAG: DUF1854 domain-containing protein [Ruminococcaceae bacterium]|nr:DUF1854 domain-containing protein [Oscillospiraceae bacterium]